MKVRRPYAFCCIEGGGRVNGCLCSNPEHGFAIVDVKSMLPGDELVPTPTDTADRREAVALHIIFDGPPGPEAGRFVECETPDGKSISAGDWREREDGFWELRIPASLIVVPDGMGLKPAIEAQMAAIEAKAAETLWEGAPLLKGLTGYIRAMIAAATGEA